MKHTFVIAAGGTGGHVIPGVEIARELRRRGHECVFVGTERGMERRLAPEAGFAVEFLKIGALKGASIRGRLGTLAQAPASIWAARGILKRSRAAAVLTLGGYASGPTTAAAIVCGIPVVAMEPNSYPGLANRLAARWVRKALLGFSEAAKFFPAGRSETIGTPVRKEFFEIARKKHNAPATVLITGGSQGARRLNEAALEAAKIWSRQGFPGGMRLLHQTGAADYERVRERYGKLGPSDDLEIEAMAFCDDMAGAFERADLVICRAGASALAELAAAGKAAVLVPYPHAADDHQFHNARAFVTAGAARMALDQEWNGERMVREIGAVLGAVGRLEKMEGAARRLSSEGAVEKTADELERAARKEKV